MCEGEGSTEPGASGASIPPRKASDGEASGSDAEEEVVRDEKDSGRNMFKPDEKQLKVRRFDSHTMVFPPFFSTLFSCMVLLIT